MEKGQMLASGIDVALEQFRSCRSEVKLNGEKSIHFNRERQTLWQEASLYLRNPVKATVYTDKEIIERSVPPGGTRSLYAPPVASRAANARSFLKTD